MRGALLAALGLLAVSCAPERSDTTHPVVWGHGGLDTPCGAEVESCNGSSCSYGLNIWVTDDNDDVVSVVAQYVGTQTRSADGVDYGPAPPPDPGRCWFNHFSAIPYG